ACTVAAALLDALLAFDAPPASPLLDGGLSGGADAVLGEELGPIGAALVCALLTSGRAAQAMEALAHAADEGARGGAVAAAGGALPALLRAAAADGGGSLMKGGADALRPLVAYEAFASGGRACAALVRSAVLHGLARAPLLELWPLFAPAVGHGHAQGNVGGGYAGAEGEGLSPVELYWRAVLPLLRLAEAVGVGLPGGHAAVGVLFVQLVGANERTMRAAGQILKLAIMTAAGAANGGDASDGARGGGSLIEARAAVDEPAVVLSGWASASLEGAGALAALLTLLQPHEARAQAALGVGGWLKLRALALRRLAAHAGAPLSARAPAQLVGCTYRLVGFARAAMLAHPQPPQPPGAASAGLAEGGSSEGRLLFAPSLASDGAAAAAAAGAPPLGCALALLRTAASELRASLEGGARAQRAAAQLALGATLEEAKLIAAQFGKAETAEQGRASAYAEGGEGEYATERGEARALAAVEAAGRAEAVRGASLLTVVEGLLLLLHGHLKAFHALLSGPAAGAGGGLVSASEWAALVRRASTDLVPLLRSLHSLRIAHAPGGRKLGAEGGGKLLALAPGRWQLVEVLCARSLALVLAREAVSEPRSSFALGGGERLLIEGR
ncbi:hypothetical protein T492DRAFT_879361, partial [Pavlovales sp. CCMP2436]